MADTRPAAGDPPTDPPETTPPGPTSPPVPAPDPPADPTSPVDGDPPDLAAVRREAAGYRTRLRDTEQERDQLRDRVEAMERADVERIAAASGMAVPSDLWLLVGGLDELRVDGALNPDRVSERVGTILRERPSWKRPTPAPAGGSRLGNGVPRDLGLYDLVEQARSRR
jgi:hypothetical protein